MSENMNKVIENEYKIILFLSFLCYSVTIFGDFLFDDTEAIIGNKDVITDTNLSTIFSNDFWGTELRDNSSHKSYRPLTVIAFGLIRRLDNIIESKIIQTVRVDSPLNSYLFHSINVCFYAILNIFLLKVLKKLLNTFCASNETNNSNINNINGFLVTVLFTCHPIHSESVSACVGLADLLSALIALIALFLYIECTDSLKHYNYGIIGSESQMDLLIVNLFISVAFTFNCLSISLFSGIGMLFKEQTITFIGLCALLDLILVIERPNGNCAKIPTKLLVYRITCLALSCLPLILMRLWIMNFSGPQFQKADNPSSFEESLYLRLINYSYIYALNAWILIYPDWLCFDWSMGCIPLIKTLLDFRIIFVLLFWMSLCLLIKSSVLHCDPNIRRQLKLSLVFCFVPFIPSANIFFRVGFVIAERALFLPTIGYLMLIITAINLLQKRFVIYSKAIYLCLLFLAFVFTIRTIRRSFDWINEKQLFESGLDVCPLNAKVHYNIAKNAADFGLKQKAIDEYREAIRLNPEYDSALNNLANILKESGDLYESKELLLKAVRIRPTFSTAWMNLGIVQTALNQYLDAETSYLTAIKLRHRYAECLYNLGNLYIKLNRFEEAYRALWKAVEIKPKLLSAWNNMILMFDNMGSYAKAETIALEALRHHSNQSSLYFNYANILGKMKAFVESETYFKRAIDLDPQKANYYANLGVLYHRWKDYPKAKANYEIALKIDPNLESAQKNLNLLNKLLINS